VISTPSSDEPVSELEVRVACQQPAPMVGDLKGNRRPDLYRLGAAVPIS
jgi:hypothetical protein